MKNDDVTDKYCEPIIIASESYVSHLYWLLSSTIALMGALILLKVGGMVTISMVGHLGTDELAGMSLVHMLDECLSFCITAGMAATLDTLCGQSWTGTIDKTVIGLHFQRGLCIYLALYLPVVIFWGGSLIMLQNVNFVGPEVVHYASIYMSFIIPGSLVYGISYMLGAYLRAQGIMRVSFYGALVSFPVSAITNYVLMAGHPFSIGIAGAGIANAAASFSVCALSIGYIYWINGSQGWGGWTWDCLRGWIPTLRLFIPSLLLVILQLALPRLCSLAASRFGAAALGAHFILLNTNATCISFGISLKHAIVTRIGNLMGKGALADAKRTIMVGNLLALGTGMIVAILLVTFRSHYPFIFTNDQVTARIVSESLPLIALIQVFDSLGYNQIGIAYGIGRQRSTAWITFISYIFIGVPCCYFCAFSLGWSVYGLWMGNVVAEFLVCVLLFLHLNTLDWSKEARRIMNQIPKEG
ncbi:mate-domain-containing protein [Phascolomyces articulosus]|uniref:Mate-domain-containing protein n=1 Tax=Phascolomyces articulosus TaxID=60185 RepID=A0AAD5JLB3_9FUNG|nr:mate-domain-containing protein [Phascolomyces articulosus]